MAILTPTRVSTERFTYDPASRIFVAEASDLPRLSPVYDDACDFGLTLVSAKTGKEVVFQEERNVYDGEGELVATVLGPVNARELAPGTEIHILND